jgi:hypothetical protein
LSSSHFQLQGQSQEAMKTYANMINRKSADSSSLAVATTNLISLKGTKDAADSLRKLDRLFEKSTAPNQLQLIENLDFKLSTRQKEALYSARVLLLLHANKTDQVCFCKVDSSYFSFVNKSPICFVFTEGCSEIIQLYELIFSHTCEISNLFS